LCVQQLCLLASRVTAAAPQEQAFREFCALPENAKLVEKSQRSEMRKIRRNAEQAAAIRFREVVLASPPEAQRNIAPYLAIPVLRRVVQTMTNDEQGDFGRWACNPLVLSMLRETRQALADGRMTEAEVERLLIAQAKARAARGGGAARGSESLLTSFARRPARTRSWTRRPPRSSRP